MTFAYLESAGIFAELAWFASGLCLFAAVPMAGGLLGSRRVKTKSARGSSE